MKRRDFILKTLGAGAGVAAGATIGLGGYHNLMGANPGMPQLPHDLVAVKGGDPVTMFDKAMKSLGGMKNFVKQNQTVVVKPNIGWDVPPERAGNTNPNLVGRIIEHCFEAGAKKVYVFDHTCDKWNKCYETSGIEKAAKDNGATVVPGNTEGYYQEVEVQGGKSLTLTKIHELLMESDVFINVPILKHHGSADLSIAMKNLMGVVWDRGYWHRNDLHQCIADYCTYKRIPDLNIIDAYRVMKRNGPRGVSVDDVIMMKQMIVSTDIVAADAAATRIFGEEPSDIGHIKIADNMGVGTMDLSKLNIDRVIL
ncbi:MAG: DUF362 domain-containing protein [Bacteroidales bacterium]|nr:DUF362 domain-containing protein [Bacteroidales bacterium]